MNDALLISGGKIAGSVILLALVLWGVSKLAKIAKLDPEIGRKLVHISLGLYCLTFPYVFGAVWEVVATCGLAVLVFLLARGTMRESLGGGLHAVKRVSYGELLFAVSVALLFWLKDGHFVSLALHHKPPVGPVLYMLPILILTLCDAASAVVGSRYGKQKFQIEEGSKSVEGVVVFAVTAWLLSLIVILLMTDIGRSEAVLLAFIVNENLPPGSMAQNLLMKVLLVLVAVSVLYSVLVCFVPETGWYSDVYPWAYQDVIETAQFWT